MNQPLWRIFLHIMLLAFVIQRATMAVMLHLEGAGPLVVAAFVLQCVAGLVTSLAILRAVRWEVGAVVVTGATVALGALYAALVSPLITLSAALTQIVAAVLATAALSMALRHEARERERDEGGSA